MNLHDGLAAFWQSAICSISVLEMQPTLPSGGIWLQWILMLLYEPYNLSIYWRLCEPMLGRLNSGTTSSDVHESFLL